MTAKGKRNLRGKWNFLLMRPKGEVASLSLSPFLLAGALLFAAIFVAASLATINLYFDLYLEFRDLNAAYQETAAKLARLENQYRYHLSAERDYAELLRDPGDPGEPEQPARTEETANQAGPAAADPLETWAAALDGPPGGSDDSLDIDDFKVEGNRFSFLLLNGASSGALAQGRLLALFLVEAEGEMLTAPFPDFDVSSPQPDFDLGPGYNIRSSKSVSGQLKTPAGGEIMAMMVAAKSRDGRLVMKKRVTPK